MTLAELIARYRVEANDKEVPYFISDEDATAFANEAVREACVRGRLLYESQDDDVCMIDVAAGQAVYPLHPSLYELASVLFYPDGEGKACPLPIKSVEWLDSSMRDWRACVDKPRYVVQEDTGLRLVPTPAWPGTVHLEGYRVPLADMELIDKDTVQPEINGLHHAHLTQWMLHKAFSIPDMELFDAQRAADAEAAFTRYFGERPDADLRRITREDVPHHVEAFWP